MKFRLVLSFSALILIITLLILANNYSFFSELKARKKTPSSEQDQQQKADNYSQFLPVIENDIEDENENDTEEVINENFVNDKEFGNQTRPNDILILLFTGTYVITFLLHLM
jgi:hypothetical protein